MCMYNDFQFTAFSQRLTAMASLLSLLAFATYKLLSKASDQLHEHTIQILFSQVLRIFFKGTCRHRYQSNSTWTLDIIQKSWTLRHAVHMGKDHQSQACSLFKLFGFWLPERLFAKFGSLYCMQDGQAWSETLKQAWSETLKVLKAASRH